VNIKINLKPSILLSLSFLLVSCGNGLTDWIFPIKGKDLDPLKKEVAPVKPKIVTPYVEICDADPIKESDELLVTFALDITGSNRLTDQQRTNRYQNLLDWIDKRVASGIDTSNEKYALIEFSLRGQIVNGGQFDPKRPFIPIDEFRQIVDKQFRGGSTDLDGTPYQATVNKMREILELEIKERVKKHEEELKTNKDAKKVTFQSLNIMLSDGQPCSQEDGGSFFPGQPNPPACPQFGQIQEGLILDRVESLVDDFTKDPVYGQYITQVNLNTGFYEAPGGDNIYAKELLRKMADKGRGIFFDFSNGAKIDYDQVVRVVVRTIRISPNEWEVKNLNVQWNEDYEIQMVDTDFDGLPDALENPAYCKDKWDCDGDGIRDGIYFKNHHGFSCETMLDNSNGQTKCRTKPDNCPKNQQGEYLDEDGDTLRQCEEKAIGSNDEKFDTNNDFIVDDTAYYRSYYIGSPDQNIGMPPMQDSDGDGHSDYEEIQKLFSPWTIPMYDHPGIKPLEYKRVDENYDPVLNKKCNYWRITNMPLLMPGKDDLIQFTIIYRPRTGFEQKTFIKIAKVKMKQGELNIKEKDFKSYIVK
jgi:hypothetical protein